MSTLPVATVYGEHDVIAMQPMPDPASVSKHSSADPVEHTVGDDTEAVWIILLPSAAGRCLMLYRGPAADVDPNRSIPVAQQSNPFAVRPGSTFTLSGDGGAAFDYWIQEATF